MEVKDVQKKKEELQNIYIHVSTYSYLLLKVIGL